MSFSAAVQWWEDWQLRLLVLASLFFQYFLFAAAIVRKLRIPHWFRALIWLAYQGGDVVAIYALATLFTRHKEEGLATNPATAHLQTLWAPILLLHLGGQDGITAYSIEDNENWRRHLLISVSQITVAIYVFRKSWWSGDKTLLRAAILLFVPGILKCLEKPWALKNATVTSIMNSSDSQLKETLNELDAVQKDIYSQEDYVQAAAGCIAKLNPQQREEFIDDKVADKPHHLFVDLGHPYSIRLQNLGFLAPLSAKAVHELVRSSLSKGFDRLYTKDRASVGGLVRAAVALVTFVVIGLFHRRHRGVYDRADIVVTYVLLGCTAALELVSACLVLWSGLPGPDDKLAQYNLFGYLARDKKHRRLLALARLLGARLPLDRLWCTAAAEPSVDITGLVYDHVAGGWKDYIWEPFYEHDAATGGWKRKLTQAHDGVRAYRQFNDSRGQLTLEREACIGRRAIEESLRMPFDESVVLWHLATEFCYVDNVDTGHDAVHHSRTVSNYMAYLLFVEPEMLIPGARSKLFSETYHDLRKMLNTPPEFAKAVGLELTERKAPPLRAKNEMVRKVIQKVKSTISHDSEDPVHKAWAIAHELIEFAEEKKMDFIKDQTTRGKNREEVISVLRCAKEKADEFIDIKKKKRYKVLNNLMEFMRSAKAKAGNNAEEPVECKQIFIKDMKEAKEKIESFIKEVRAKKQTKEEEEEEITKFLQGAKNKAKEFIENEYEEEKKKAEVPMDMEEDRETKKVLMVKDFSHNAKEVIRLAGDEKKELMDKTFQKKNRIEAKEKTEEFIKKANKFIREEQNKNQTKEEEKITDLLESAMKKAYEFIKNEQKMAAEPNPKTNDAEEENDVDEEKSVLAVQEFSNHAGEAMKLVEKEKKNLADLMEMNLISNEEELRMIQGKEYAADKMWAVIQGVWVEMLCFSASRCCGYLHAKRLGNGGEYLSYVWLLLYYTGMETMPERMQRLELPAFGDTGDLAETPKDEEWDDEPARVRRRIKSSTETAQAQRDLEIG